MNNARRTAPRPAGRLTSAGPAAGQYHRVLAVLDPDLTENSPLHPLLNEVWPQVAGLSTWRQGERSWQGPRRCRRLLVVECDGPGHGRRRRPVAEVCKTTLGAAFVASWVESHQSWQPPWSFPGLSWIPLPVTVVRDVLERSEDLPHPPLRVRCPRCGESELSRRKLLSAVEETRQRLRRRDDGHPDYYSVRDLI